MSLQVNVQKIQKYVLYSHDHVEYVRDLHMTWTVAGVCVLMFGCFMLMFVDLVEQSRGVINCSLKTIALKILK